jgi:hypothetical protein
LQGALFKQLDYLYHIVVYLSRLVSARGGFNGPQEISGISSETREDPKAVVRAPGNLSEGDSEF